jgi:hypothetical protein
VVRAIGECIGWDFDLHVVWVILLNNIEVEAGMLGMKNL